MAGTLNQHWPVAIPAAPCCPRLWKRAQRTVVQVWLSAPRRSRLRPQGLFGQQSVLDAHFPTSEIQDIVFVRKHAALPGLLCP